MSNAKSVRVLLLLVVLLIVALGAWRDRAQTTSWKHPLYLVVYPINGDGSDASARTIATLTPERFAPVEAFFSAEASRYGVKLEYDQPPVRVSVAPEVHELPPAPPPNGNILAVMAWSLRLRWWAWQHGDYKTGPGQIRMFVLYYDPDRHPRLAHSLGLEKGLIGVVNAFAGTEMEGENQVVIAHEFLHTVGASDKYDPATTLPLFPEGYADPGRQPRYPQAAAELMGGRIPLSPADAEIPEGLHQTMVGTVTAAEIGWLK